MASQARHKMDAPKFGIASRLVVPSEGRGRNAAEVALGSKAECANEFGEIPPPEEAREKNRFGDNECGTKLSLVRGGVDVADSDTLAEDVNLRHVIG